MTITRIQEPFKSPTSQYTALSRSLDLASSEEDYAWQEAQCHLALAKHYMTVWQLARTSRQRLEAQIAEAAHAVAI